jgi:hypothetical protein
MIVANDQLRTALNVLTGNIGRFMGIMESADRVAQMMVPQQMAMAGQAAGSMNITFEGGIQINVPQGADPRQAGVEAADGFMQRVREKLRWQGGGIVAGGT